MSEQELADQRIIQAAVSLLMKPVAELIYHDSHHWSKRSCGTCQSITSIIGEPFGCNRYAIEEARRNRARGE